MKWYKKVKEENGPEKYVGSWEGHVAVRLRFWLRSSSAGLFEDKNRYRKRTDVCRVMERRWKMLSILHWSVRSLIDVGFWKG